MSNSQLDNKGEKERKKEERSKNGQGLGRGGRQESREREAFCVVKGTVRERKPKTN